MPCLNLQDGLFVNAGPTLWTSGPGQTANGAKIDTSNKDFVTIEKGGGNETFTVPAGGNVMTAVFGAPKNFILVMTTGSAAPGFPSDRFITHVDVSGKIPKGVLLDQVPAKSTDALPHIQTSPGDGALFLLVIPQENEVKTILARSDNGVNLTGTTVIGAANSIIGEVGAAKIFIKEGGKIIASAERPLGECHVVIDPLKFPEAVLGVSTPERVETIRNTGSDCLKVTSVGSVEPFQVLTPLAPEGVVLEPNKELKITIRFAPSKTGPHKADLPITCTPQNGDSVIHCSGTARDVKKVIAFPGFIPFGGVPLFSTKTQPVTFQSFSEVPIAVDVAASTSGEFQWTALHETLAPGKAATLQVAFTPTSEGPREGVLQFTSDADSSPAQITLTGSGCVARATIVPPPVTPAIDLGNVQRGFRAVRLLEVANGGFGPLQFRARITEGALFGVQTAGGSVTGPATELPFQVLPVTPCGEGAAGSGKGLFAVTFHANGEPGKAAAKLVIDQHNDPNAAPSFTYDLTATIVEAVSTDTMLAIDYSASMLQKAGERTKIDVAIDAARLFVALGRTDAGDRLGLVKFHHEPTVFRPIADLTTAAQMELTTIALSLAELEPDGDTSVAGGVFAAVQELAGHPRPSPPPLLNKAVVVLTDAKDNTPYVNPADGVTYTLLGDPGTTALPPQGMRVYGIGIGDSIDVARLGHLAQATGGDYLTVATFEGADYFKLEKHFTQIYMNIVDLDTIVDPTYVIALGETHTQEFQVLSGDVKCMVVVYDRDGIRVPCHLVTPSGEVIELTLAPEGFQVRPGVTSTARFLEVRFPAAEPARFAGTWKLVMTHAGQAWVTRHAKISPSVSIETPVLQPYDKPITYGFAIGVGSNFRMQAFVDPGVVHVGEPIRLNAVLGEFGQPVTGGSVVVTAVSPSGATSTLELRDDGLHGDGEADDGDYGGLFTHTAEAGNYELTFSATGISRDGEPVSREAVRGKYVEGTTPLIPVTPPDGGKGGTMKGDCCKWIVFGLWWIIFLLILILVTLWIR